MRLRYYSAPVSYTHLDVYKRQVQKNWDDNNDSGRPKEIVVKLTGTVNDGSQTPVVVYEQEITLKPSLAQKLLNGAILEEPSHWKMTLSGLPKYDTQQRRITYNVTAVSYTHLDVYKRQDMKLPMLRRRLPERPSA